MQVWCLIYLKSQKNYFMNCERELFLKIFSENNCFPRNIKKDELFWQKTKQMEGMRISNLSLFLFQKYEK